MVRRLLLSSFGSIALSVSCRPPATHRERFDGVVGQQSGLRPIFLREFRRVIDGGFMTLFLPQSLDHGLAAKKRLDDRTQQIAAARGGGVKF